MKPFQGETVLSHCRVIQLLLITRNDNSTALDYVHI